MLSRISVVRSAPRLFVVPVRYKTSSVEGSVAQSKGFSKKEKAHEDEYVHRHELELLQKIRNEILKKKSELDSLEKQHTELENSQKK